MNTIAKAIEPLIDSAPPDLPQLLEWKWANIKDNLNQIKAFSTTSESVDEIFFQRIFCGINEKHVYNCVCACKYVYVTSNFLIHLFVISVDAWKGISQLF